MANGKLDPKQKELIESISGSMKEFWISENSPAELIEEMRERSRKPQKSS